MNFNISKRTVGYFLGTIALLFYAVAAIMWSSLCRSRQLCAGLAHGGVEVVDTLHTGFVTSAELTRELQPMLGNLTERRIDDIDLDSLQRYLAGLDKIESARVRLLNNNMLSISVVPLTPVARVWPGNGRSYYVNRDGKRIGATWHYRVDVPQIQGNFRGRFTPVKLLPLLDYLNEHPDDAGSLVTMISARDSLNIYIVPPIRGHVVNLGDVHNLDDKFRRLSRFYAEVLPVKGWEFYDTISVKFDNQVVANRRHDKLPDLSVNIIDELEHEEDDPESFVTPLTEEQIKKP